MDEITYKGFSIEAVPELHDGKWSTKISIVAHREKRPKGSDL